jgi:hypothetical protein
MREPPCLRLPCLLGVVPLVTLSAVYGPDHAQVLVRVNNLGSALLRAGDPVQFKIRRCAWRMLDHARELEDRWDFAYPHPARHLPPARTPEPRPPLHLDPVPGSGGEELTELLIRCSRYLWSIASSPVSCRIVVPLLLVTAGLCPLVAVVSGG